MSPRSAQTGVSHQHNWVGTDSNHGCWALGCIQLFTAALNLGQGANSLWSDGAVQADGSCDFHGVLSTLSKTLSVAISRADKPRTFLGTLSIDPKHKYTNFIQFPLVSPWTTSSLLFVLPTKVVEKSKRSSSASSRQNAQRKSTQDLLIR